MSYQVPTSLRDFSRTGFLQRLWWSVRPRALERAQQLGVAPEIEARLRTVHQISRTWLLALAVSALITCGDLAWTGAFTLNDALQLLLLVAGQVGGLFALRRSNETRAYLHRVHEMVQDVATHAAFVSVLARERQASCVDIDELRQQALVTLQALKHSILFPHVDAFSLWARDDTRESWRMVAGIGPSARSVRGFTQPILAAEEPGAGVVANLAAVGQGEYYQPRPGQCVVGKPAWFATNPLAESPAVTVAVFLLPDEYGVPVGAFALTSRDDDALSCERLSDFPREVRLILSQCTVSLEGLARRAAELWRKTVLR
ncbi:MAG: hypothetical protein JWN48_1446 [Myxococcaceae bacterium]|nr:hypothetical protein [Myxococcaceae bacterium]